MHSFYIPDIETNTRELFLNEEESKHACRVLRLQNQDEIQILDGKGHTFDATIIENNPKKCKINIDSYSLEEKSEHEIHIALAPTKNMDRIEWFFEKSTELGITEISLFFSKNSERKQVKTERLEKILVSAMKQSQRTYLPKLNIFNSLVEFLEKNPAGAIAHCYDETKSNLKSCFKTNNFPILIGPEGDFTLDEVKKAQEYQYTTIDLGKNRLRTETAALYACMFAKTIIES
jgi:16S rRNA (uracil1498-N3)-methyltransferase